jgi:FAD synthetase
MSRVAVFGTFDIFHPGHRSFFSQAKKQGDYLLIVVARDEHVKNAKGNHPKNSEIKRVKTLKKSYPADKVILGSKTHNYFRTLRTYGINKIVLGYDQKPTLAELRKSLKRHRLSHIEISRARAYNPSRYKSSKLS